MPTRLTDLFTYALLIGVMILAFMGYGCATNQVAHSAVPALADIDRVPYQATVKLHMPGGACSGVAIDQHFFLTAKHCVGGGPYEVEAFPGVSGPAELVIAYEDRDAALMRTPLVLQATATIYDGPPLPAGELVIIAGFGCLKTSLFVTSGVYFGVGASSGQLLIAASVCPGDSGGPVFTKKGQVVGLTSGRGQDLPVAAAAPTRGL